MEVGIAFSLISRAVDAGSVPGGYLFCGSAERCAELEALVSEKLFPGAEALLESGEHPDVLRVAPSGKRREITVDSVRECIVEPMSSSSFCGGWRLAVVNEADRLNRQAANALLKSLEEPPPKSLFILESAAPDSMLPTILSRVQRIDLPFGGECLDGEAYEAVKEAMEDTPEASFSGRMRFGRRLSGILDEILADEEAPADAEKRFFLTIIRFAREWLVSGKVERFLAMRNIEAVEAAARQCAKSINKEAALCRMADRMTFP